LTQVSPEDRRRLDAAVRYATLFLGTTGDNPCAAALVVDPSRQTLIARAVTARGGRPHAEAISLASAGLEAAGSTLYATLQPCHHWGRTPPCVDAIVRAGVMRVWIGAADPAPLAAATGLGRLQSAGIEVVLADHAPSAALHAGHLHLRTDGRPHVTAMLVVSADDRIVSPPAGAARDLLDLQRARADAILIGAAMARHHNQQLAVAIPGLAARTPLRVVLAGAQGIDRSLNLVGRLSGYRTAVIAESSVPVDAPASVEVLRVAGLNGHPDLRAVLTALGKKGLQNLLIEPGARLAAALLQASLIDCFGLIVSKDAANDGPPAASTGKVAKLIAAAGLVETEHQNHDTATLKLYRRPA